MDKAGLIILDDKTLVNVETGELVEIKREGAGMSWFRGIRKGFRRLAIMGLSAMECAIFFEIAGRLKRGNICLVNQSELAEHLGFSRSAVSKALGNLEKHKIIEKDGKTGVLIQYRMNQHFCWIGWKDVN